MELANTDTCSLAFDAEMVGKAIWKLKSGKTAAVFGLAAEILKASGDTGMSLATNSLNSVARRM